MTNLPFISIIIPVKNAERTLDESFKHILNIKYPRDKMEIVIGDGGSTDKTIAIINQWQNQYPFIKLVKIPNCQSPGYARNKMLDLVKSEFIFFTDGDCAPCESWITDMIKAFDQDPKIGIVGGEIYTLVVDPENITELYCENFRFNMVAPRYGYTITDGYFPELTDKSPTQIAGHRAYFFVTANSAFRKQAINQANARFWDEKTGEDIDFGLQIQNYGWKLYFEPKARVNHMHRSDFPALKKVWVTYGMAHAPLLAKHASNKLDIVFQIFGSWPKIPLISFACPIKGFIYVGYFQIMHLCGIITVITALIMLLGTVNAANSSFLFIFIGLTLYCARRYFDVCFKMKPSRHFFSWCKMKYMTNLMFIIGGLKRSRKFKTICIEPSF